MNNAVQEFMNELKIIDPEFRDEANETMFLIEKIVNGRPLSPLRNEFCESVKIRLLERIASAQSEKSTHNGLRTFAHALLHFIFFLLGVAFAGFVLIVLLPLLPHDLIPSDLTAILPSIPLTSSVRDAVHMSPNTPPFVPFDWRIATGSFVPESIPITLTTDPSLHYSYTGSMLAPITDTVRVLRRRAVTVSVDTEHLPFRTDLFDIGSGVTLANVTLLSSRLPEYTWDINLSLGTLSAVRNGPSDSPVSSHRSPEEIVEIFFSDVGISRDAYGSGTIDTTSWRSASIVTIRYPLLLDGKNIYDTNTSIVSMTVRVDTRAGVVEGVEGMRILSYSASMFDTESSLQRIVTLASGYDEDSAPIHSGIVVPLGNPVLAYLRVFPTMSGASDEYIIPAYVFPVLATGRAAKVLPLYRIVPAVSAFLPPVSTESIVSDDSEIVVSSGTSVEGMESGVFLTPRGATLPMIGHNTDTGTTVTISHRRRSGIPLVDLSKVPKR